VELVEACLELDPVGCNLARSANCCWRFHEIGGGAESKYPASRSWATLGEVTSLAVHCLHPGSSQPYRGSELPSFGLLGVICIALC
jgi:hypothetical protein